MNDGKEETKAIQVKDSFIAWQELFLLLVMQWCLSNYRQSSNLSTGCSFYVKSEHSGVCTISAVNQETNVHMWV